MLKATFNRVRQDFSSEDIYVATSVNHEQAVREQLPELPSENLVLEPCRRETASAIGYALLQISRHRPDETFVLINSDAHIKDVDAYHRTIRTAGKLTEKYGRTVMIGIRPTYEETGYGYIKMSEEIDNVDGLQAYKVESFVEKPDLETVKKYLASGDHLWNATLLVSSVSGFLRSYERHLPDHADIFQRMREVFDSPDEDKNLRNLFARLPAVSIDYGILEKENDLIVLPADFGWMDIGNWRTVREVLARQEGENVVRGKHVSVDSSANLIHCPEGKLVATVGISDMIIVDSGDALLICPQERAHEVKSIVARLKEDETLNDYL